MNVSKYENIQFTDQYNKMYINRLNHFLPIIKNKTRSYKHTILTEITENESLIIGTLFLVSDLKPSIFDELKSSKKTKNICSTYYSEDAKWFVEDKTGRVEVKFADKIFADKDVEENFALSSGMILGFVGREIDKGIFYVSDVIFPGFISPSTQKESSEAYKICFLSGGWFDKCSNGEKLYVILEYLKSVDKIIIFGELFSDQLDLLNKIDRLCKNVSFFKDKVILVPSLLDATTNLVPQEPFHRKIYKLRSVPNPCTAEINNKKFILTSGENVFDLIKYFRNELEDIQSDVADYRMHLKEDIPLPKIEDYKTTQNCIKAMTTILKLQYLCPTAPDTLKSVPFNGKDTFYLEENIDYFVCGNVNEFFYKEVNNSNSVLIGIPKFCNNNIVVLLNYYDRKIETIKFK